MHRVPLHRRALGAHHRPVRRAAAPLGALGLALALGYVPSAAAQRLTVVVKHYAAPSTTAVDDEAYYLKPGASESDRSHGMPPAVMYLAVAPGEKVCYVIRGANPLLYAYSTSAVNVPVSAPPDLAKIVEGLQVLVQQSPSFRIALRGDTLAVDTTRARVALYRELVNRLGVTLLREAAATKTASDSVPSFHATYLRDAAMWKQATETAAKADTLYGQMSPDAKQSVSDLRSLQRLALAQLTAAHRAVDAAAKSMSSGHDSLTVCKPMLAGRTRYFLSIKAREDSTSVKPGRVTSGDKEELASFTVDPQYTERFRVAPGLFVAGLFSGDRDVGAQNGTLTIERSDRTYTRTGMFAMGRATTHIWPTLGVAKGDGKSVDVFAGLQLRAGDLVLGPEISLGAGVAWMDVPVGAGSLKQGDPIPNGKKLEDVISRDRQLGFSLTFTVSGLKFGKGDKAGEGTADVGGGKND